MTGVGEEDGTTTQTDGRAMREARTAATACEAADRQAPPDDPERHPPAAARRRPLARPAEAGPTITPEVNGDTLVTGPVVDQAASRGLLTGRR